MTQKEHNQKIPLLTSKPIIGCTTDKDVFCDRIEAAATELGTDFCASSDLRSTFEKCQSRVNSCLIVDYESANGLSDKVAAKQATDSYSMIVVIPRGDVIAAFRSAEAGADNVIENPVTGQDLMINLQTALAINARMNEIRNSDVRFSNDYFECLSRREKQILGLLMNGEPNKRVAAILDIGLRTVEAERAGVMKKLQVSSFVELIKTVSTIENDCQKARKTLFGSLLAQQYKKARHVLGSRMTSSLEQPNLID